MDWNRVPPSVFYAYASGLFAARLAKQRTVRDQVEVLGEYEPQRVALLEELAQNDWSLEDYVRRVAGVSTMPRQAVYFMHGRLSTDLDRVLSLILGDLERAVARYEPATVLEVGSGTGRNLLWLAHRLNVQGTGLELTPTGVEVSNAAAGRYGLTVDFRVKDVLEAWDDVPEVDVVFSVAALEQIPHSAGVIDAMQAKARKAVVLFEPFPDFWTGLQAVASGLRVRQLDRLRPGALDGRFVTHSRPLPYGTALNRSAEVHLPGHARAQR